MDPPDVLGMDSGVARPTKLPNRAKSKCGILFFFLCWKTLKVHLFSEHAPPRPPLPAVLLKSEFSSSSAVPKKNVALLTDLFALFAGVLEPFYDSVVDDYADGDDAAASGAKRPGASLGLKLKPWDFGVRSATSEVSLIDFTDDSFSSNTPSPLTESRQPDQDTLKVRLGDRIRISAHTPNAALRTSPARTRRPSWTGPSHSQRTTRSPPSRRSSRRTGRCVPFTGLWRRRRKARPRPAPWQRGGASPSQPTCSRSCSER